MFTAGFGGLCFDGLRVVELCFGGLCFAEGDARRAGDGCFAGVFREREAGDAARTGA